MELIFQGIQIGLLFGLPIGTLGTLTIQRVIQYDYHAGIITGLGSSTADFIYSFLSCFGLILISDFLNDYRLVICIGGAILLWRVGIHSMKINSSERMLNELKMNKRKMYCSALALALMNPTAIASFLFAFTYFKIPKDMPIGMGIKLSGGVFVGTSIWWMTLSLFIYFLKRRLSQKLKDRLNQGFGVILCVIAIGIFITAFL